ncbi:hypothetical protein V2J09_024263 [Rumex salicifolius]
MGNCIRRQSRAQWAGEDWEPAISPPAEPEKPAPRAVDDDLKSTKSPDSKSKRSDRREVKVKITKKQLEEVIRKMKMEVNEEEGFTVQEVLEKLMKMSSHFEAQRNMTSSAWKPRITARINLNPEANKIKTNKIALSSCDRRQDIIMHQSLKDSICNVLLFPTFTPSSLCFQFQIFNLAAAANRSQDLIASSAEI